MKHFGQRNGRWISPRGWKHLSGSEFAGATLAGSRFNLKKVGLACVLASFFPIEMDFMGFAALHAQEARAATGAVDELRTREQFDKESLALRTALHHDPLLEAPLDRLIKLYRDHNRLDDLKSMYQAHCTQYPRDPSGRAVLIRILQSLSDLTAMERLNQALVDFPKVSTILYLKYQQLKVQSDSRAPEALAEAAELETDPGRRRTWVAECLKISQESGKKEVGAKLLEKLIKETKPSPLDSLALARQCLGVDLAQIALEMSTPHENNPSDPELALEAHVISAQALAALGKHDLASEKVNAALSKLAPEHWRRSELIELRIRVAKSDEDRAALLEDAKKRFTEKPEDLSIALEYAELLQVTRLRKEALEVLVKILEHYPEELTIESKILDLQDRLGDLTGASTFLTQRLEKNPARADLQWRLVRVLYALGRSEEAQKVLDSVLSTLSPQERQTQLLELARQLRRGTAINEAASILDKLVQELPDRADIRRELAETYLVLGRREDVSRLFQNLGQSAAAPENFADAVQFLIAQSFYTEARKALLERHSKIPLPFDFQLSLLEVSSKLGSFSEGERLVTALRDQADTDVRYARWLTSAFDFYESFQQKRDFLAAERDRLLAAAGEQRNWTPALSQRFLQFVEMARRKDGNEILKETLPAFVDEPKLDAQVRLRLRRIMVELLSFDPEDRSNALGHLEKLMAEDAKHEDHTRLQLAKIYRDSNRHDLFMAMLNASRPELVDDPRILSQAFLWYVEAQLTDKAVLTSEVLTRLEPGELLHWEKRLGILVAIGDEVVFRRCVMQLLGGIKDLVLSDESRALLRTNLSASYWRSLSVMMERPDPDWNEVVALLDEFESAQDLKSWEKSWVSLTRAIAFARLDRDRESDAALESMRHAVHAEFEERQKAKAQPAKAGVAEVNPSAPAALSFPGTFSPGTSGTLILSIPSSPSTETDASPSQEKGEEQEDKHLAVRFPSGLELPLEAAESTIAWHRQQQGKAPVHAGSESGPLQADHVAWGFSLARASIVQVHAYPSLNRLVIEDSEGTFHAIDATTGKLQWVREESRPELKQGPMFLDRRMANLIRARLASIRRGVMSPSGVGLQMVKELAISEGDGERHLFHWTPGKLTTMDVQSGETLAEIYLPEGGTPSMITDPTDGMPKLGVRGVAHMKYVPHEDGGRLVIASAHDQFVGCFDTRTGKALWWQKWSPLEPVRGDSRTVLSVNTGLLVENGRVFVYGGKPLVLSLDSGALLWQSGPGMDVNFPIKLSRAGDEGFSFASSLFNARSSSRTQTHYLSTHDRRQFSRNFVNYFFSSNEVKLFSSLENVLQQFKSHVFTAELVDDKLVLLEMNDFDALVISLNLPLQTQMVPIRGMVIGKQDGRLVTLTSQALNLYNARTSDVVRHPIRVSENAQTDFPQGVVSANRVYVTGSRGVQCFQLHTGEEIFFHAWEDLVPQFAVAEGAASNASQGQSSVQFQPSPVLPFSARGKVDPEGTILPNRCWVQDGVLYAIRNDQQLYAIRDTRPEPAQPSEIPSPSSSGVNAPSQDPSSLPKLEDSKANE